MHLAKNGVFPSPKLDLDRNDARHGSKITIQKKTQILVVFNITRPIWSPDLDPKFIFNGMN